MTLGQRISTYRKRLGISQEELGGRLGVSRQAVSKWETDAATPDMGNLLALAREFGVSVAELTETQEAMPESVLEAPEELAAMVEAPTASPPDRPHRWKRAALLAALALLAGYACYLSFLAGNAQEQAPVDHGESVNIPDTEFLLTWEGPDQQNWLALGTQESLFPFDRTLVPTKPETVTDSGFPNDTYHDVTCGDLTLRYSHLSETPEYDVLRMLETGSRAYQTPRGIGVGSSEADVLSAYGDALIYCLPTYGPDTDISYDEYYVYTPEGFESLLFLMAGDHVVGLRMEDASYPYYHVNNRDSFPVVDGKVDLSQRQDSPMSTEQAVYDALNALVTRTDLTAEELYTNRNTIFGDLDALDWWAFGKLGATEHPEDTIGTLLAWLREQSPYSENEIFCLQMGCASNLDGWLADSYAGLLSAALFENPIAFVKGLAYDSVEDTMYQAIRFTAYDAELYPVELKTALETLDAAIDSGIFTEAERGWAELLRLYLTTPIDQRNDLPRSPAELSS